MSFVFEERLSDSALVEGLWRTHSERASTFVSTAENRPEIVITKYQGKTNLTVRGPETKAAAAESPADAEFFGIVFKPGTFMPKFPPGTLLDRNDVTLPAAASTSFWLNGAAWQFPDFDNADTFVDRLVRAGLLVHDPVVNAVLNDQPLHYSMRQIRRRFLLATGLTHSYIRQIKRARYAMTLLHQGVSILDTVVQAGYFDQPHLTRALKHFMGQTPAQVLLLSQPESMSLLYKTEPPG